jgi:AmmeMemoRadiSam system protein B
VNPIEVGKILFELSKKDHGPDKGDIFFIVSSDLSHFMNYENAVQTDEETLNDFLDRDIDKIINEAEACGIHPRLALTQLAIQSKRTPQLLKYLNS